MMKNIFAGLLLLLFVSRACAQPGMQVFHSREGSDTAYIGIYVNSIHNIDFKQNEYSIDFWLWVNSNVDTLNFIQNLQIPNAKSVTKEDTMSVKTENGRYELMRIQCLMKDNWTIRNFPFDRQVLRLSFENSKFDSSALIIAPDTHGDQYDNLFTINGWKIDSFNMATGRRVYRTNFGAQEFLDRVVYSSLRVKIGIERNAGGLFWKMFLGMYLAFLIAFICYYIHPDDIGSRFGLSVGAVFAVIGNKYVVDSALPESGSFTLVDTLHGLTLFAVFIVIFATVISLRLIKSGRAERAKKFDLRASYLTLGIYVIANIIFIWRAVYAG